MPELPEVETIKNDLEKEIVGKTITGIDFLWAGILKGTPENEFRGNVIGQKIVGVHRRAKNIDIELSNGKYILLHMKMTGHLIVTTGDWKVDKNGKWIEKEGKESPLYDPLNQYIRMIFSLEGGNILAFSDLRKFAYAKLLSREELEKSYAEYGPEPFSKEFTEEYLRDILKGKKTAIKKILMDQKSIAGIGNIYADEILYDAKIHPLTSAEKISEAKTRALHSSIKKILTEAIKLRGTSVSDFRDTSGKMGKYGEVRRVYRRAGLPCASDGTLVKRIVVGGRGTHFCPKEQVLD